MADKLTKGEYWAQLVLARFTRTDGYTNPASGVLLLNGRIVEDGEVTGGWDCLKLTAGEAGTVGAETYTFTKEALSNAGVTTKGYPLVESDKGRVELRFLTDDSRSFRELAESMYD